MMDISGIEYLGIDRVLKRGSGEIIADLENALFVRDRISGAYLLACEDLETGMRLLDQSDTQHIDILMVSNGTLGNAAYEKYGFDGKMECYQVAYLGEKPAISTELSFRTAGVQDLAMLTEHYHLDTPEEMEKSVRMESVFLGYDQGQLVGFIGEHLEGSMGMLTVFPEYRCRGYGYALETYLIAKTMEKGFIPFGQVEKDNQNSLKLQKKIGMTLSEHLIAWLWRENRPADGKRFSE